jgi:hypothetical protein
MTRLERAKRAAAVLITIATPPEEAKAETKRPRSSRGRSLQSSRLRTSPVFQEMHCPQYCQLLQHANAVWRLNPNQQSHLTSSGEDPGTNEFHGIASRVQFARRPRESHLKEPGARMQLAWHAHDIVLAQRRAELPKVDCTHGITP